MCNNSVPAVEQHHSKLISNVCQYLLCASNSFLLIYYKLLLFYNFNGWLVIIIEMQVYFSWDFIFTNITQTFSGGSVTYHRAVSYRVHIDQKLLHSIISPEISQRL